MARPKSVTKAIKAVKAPPKGGGKAVRVSHPTKYAEVPPVAGTPKGAPVARRFRTSTGTLTDMSG